MVSAGRLQLSLGLLSAGLGGRRERHLRPRSWLSSAAQPGLVPRGVLADLPLRSVPGLAQVRASRPGRLRPDRVLPGAGPALPAVDERGRGGSRLLEWDLARG
jgi:hypothetical protein